jgi:NAD(P)-dependent dehydrogenase (short-subunit alcohol dehydrogenase family)
MPDAPRFGRDTPATEVLQGVDLTGKLAVVTGASTGIGREAARVLALAGAEVVAGARRRASVEELARSVAEVGGKIHAHELDLASEASVRAFAQAANSLGRPVDLLINNAGVMAGPLTRSDRGLENQFNTNFMGHAVLTSELAQALRRSGAARIVSLTSLGHHFSPVVFDDIQFERRAYDPWLAYGQSKTASSLLAAKAHANLASSGVSAFAVHPGLVPGTELGASASEADYATLQTMLADLNVPRTVPKTIEAGAATTVWAATAPELAGHGPLYLEDCGVAPVIDEPNYTFGVLPYALDPAQAERLWARAEHLLGRALPL